MPTGPKRRKKVSAASPQIRRPTEGGSSPDNYDGRANTRGPKDVNSQPVQFNKASKTVSAYK